MWMPFTLANVSYLKFVKILVLEGDEVVKGQPLFVIEAMKMENVLFAAQDGIVKSVVAAKGESLSVDQVILEFES